MSSSSSTSNPSSSSLSLSSSSSSSYSTLTSTISSSTSTIHDSLSSRPSNLVNEAALSSADSNSNSSSTSSTLNRKRNFPSSPVSSTQASTHPPSSTDTSPSSSFKKIKSFYKASSPPSSSSSSSSSSSPSSFSFSSSSSSSSSSLSSSLWAMPSTTLSKYLHLMDKDHLISILLHLSKSPSTHPLFTTHLPVPTVSFILQHLHDLEKKIVEALPYTRIHASSSSSSSSITYSEYALNRVRPILNDLQSTLLHFLDYFFHSTSCLLSKNDPFPFTVSIVNDWMFFLFETTHLVCRLPSFESTHPSPFHTTTPFSSTSSSLHPFTKTLLDTLKQYWQTTIHAVQSHVTSPVRSEDVGALEKWFHCLEDINTSTRGYFQDLVVAFEPWFRSTRVSSTFVSCGLLHHPSATWTSVLTPPYLPSATALATTSFWAGGAPPVAPSSVFGSHFDHDG